MLVVNLSNYTLSTPEKAVLTEGPRFATFPTMQTIDLAASIETALQISEAAE